MLENDNNNQKNQYSAKDIQVLENIEAIRKRPGMYIGSTDEKGWHHLAWEAIDNPVDEAVAGYCHKIWVTLSADQTTITIKDDGRGIPIEIHPKTKRSTLETIFTVLHSGGKFDNKVYKTSGGLHGVGVTVVNALSKYLRVESWREGKTEKLIYEKGKLISSQIIDTPNQPNGVLVEFTPDGEIFKDFTYFKAETLQRRLRELAYLNPNLELSFSNSSEAKPHIYHYAGGLASWVKEINSGERLVGTEICQEEFEEKDEKKYFYLNLAFQYNDGYEKTGVRSFCNNIRTGSGGTHVDGFETGLLKACQELIEKKNLNLSIVRDDVLEGLIVVIAVRIKEPEFTGQTKDRLANKETREVTKKATHELVNRFFQDNSTTAELIIRKIIDNASIRARIKEEQDLLRGNREEIVLPGVLSTSEESEEIFFVEGKSAGGSAEEGRDVKTQTILSLQGKPPNALKLVKKVLQNKEIRNILSVLGFANLNDLLKNNYIRFRHKAEKVIIEEEIILPEDFIYEKESEQKLISAGTQLDLEQLLLIVQETLKNLLTKSRYKKIILMADPDPDGDHISLLLITFIFKHLPYLIEGGKLFVAVPPFYRVQTKKQIHYFYNDRELEAFRREHPREERKIERIKGLGQMDSLELFESTMDPLKRRLYNLKFGNLLESDSLIKELMGIKSLGRKQRLESGEHKNAQIIIEEDEKVDIAQLALVNFLRYAYEVVEDRALPNVIDGLKPVQRRILYSLYQLGLTPNKPETTSNKIVGETMGNWHPHGDASIYNAMANMVRKDKFRYPLVYGRGNFGYDKNPPAASRYTKVRLTPYALFLLEDIAFGTVDWQKNYDDSKEEPIVLPTSLPNLLLNGSNGIAVGMSTNIPPHNLGETLTAVINLINNPELTNLELINDLPAPDFPTGGIILEKSKLASIYEKGEGTIYIRAKAQIVSLGEIKSKKSGEKIEKEKKDIIWITELPYKTSKSDIVRNISQLIKDKKIEGLKSIVDLSNWEGINIQIHFNTDYEGISLLNKLYKSTKLQNSFSVKMRALLESKPKIFSLKDVLREFIAKRLDNIRRKGKFILRKNEKELDNLETQLFIITNYEEIAAIIKNYPLEEERAKKLTEKFTDISEGKIKINSILDMQISFRQFTPERQTKLEGKITDVKEENNGLRLLISSEDKQKVKLIAELEQLKQNYVHSVRRTQLIHDSHIIDERKSIAPEEIITILSQGERKRTNVSEGEREIKIDSYLNIHKLLSLEATNVRGAGKELKTRGENLAIIKSNRRDDLWCFSNFGKLYLIPVYKLSDKSNNLRETSLAKLAEGEVIEKIISVREDFFSEEDKREKYLVFLTQKGKIKRLPLEKIGKVLGSGKRVINITKYQDKIIQASFTSGNDDIMVFTKGGKTKSFSEEKLRICGRAAYGDTAVKLQNSSGKTRCQKHQQLLEEHKTASCCDKSQGLKAYTQCPKFRELVQAMKNCSDCNKVIPTDKEQVKDEMIGLQIIFKEQVKENLCLLAIKKDDSGTKKPLLSIFKLAKRRGGSGQKSFKVEEKRVSSYCSKHESSIAKLEEKREISNEKVKYSQNKIKDLKEILNKAQGEEVNPEVIKKYEKELLVARQENKELEEKARKRREELENSKKKTKGCNDCRKNCINHENLKSKHENASCCDKKKTEIETLKEKVNKVRTDGSKSGKIKKYEQEYKELRQLSLKNRVICSQFQAINQAIRECGDCLKQKSKKAVKISSVPIKKVLLINTQVKPEIYLLAEEAACWYNKKDLVEFFHDEKKKKIQFYKGKKTITDLNFYGE